MIIDKKKFVFKTQRFLIREISLLEVNENYLSWFEDTTVKNEITAQYSSHELKELRKYVKSKLNQSDCLFLGIFAKENDQHIGNIKYEPINFREHFAFMGILLGDPDFRGQGVSSEIMPIIEERLKNILGVQKIFLGVNKTNIPAIKAYIKNGFIKDEDSEYLISDTAYLMSKKL